jgi:hypothetical protein
MAVTVGFAVLVVVGWLAFAYVAFGTPQGLAGAWAAVRALPLVAQLLVWLLLLPWMLALWVFQTGWPLWVRVLLILGLAWATYSMAVPPLTEALRNR